MSTFEEQLEADLPLFVNDAEFAIEANVAGTLVKGIFDSGVEGDREPRSPSFTCIDSDLAGVQHGDLVLIDWTPYNVDLTGVIAYIVEGYNPDGLGMASLILRVDTDIGPIVAVTIGGLDHARALDPLDVFPSEFALFVEGLDHARELTELPGIGILDALIDASQDIVNKTGNVVSSITAIDGNQYDVQGGNGVTHGVIQSPTGLDIYGFDGSAGSYFNRLIQQQAGQPFTAFIVLRKTSNVDQTYFDNQ